MVRLKGAYNAAINDLIRCFNSNMVRLKVKENEVPFWLTLFQFQYGTIKRRITTALIVVCELVSIPIWYD